MGNEIKEIIARYDTALAEKVIKEYADDYGMDMFHAPLDHEYYYEYKTVPSLTNKECAEVGINSEKCGVLQKVLGYGQNGMVTHEESVELSTAGFAQKFIDTLAGMDGKKALRVRVRWLSNNLDNIKKAMDELADIGPDAEAAIPALTKRALSRKTPDEKLKDEDIVRDRNCMDGCLDAAETLGKIGRPSKAAVPLLMKVLSDKDLKKRERAAYALSYVAKNRVLTKADIPRLVEFMKDTNNTSAARSYMSDVLECIPEAAPYLIRLLNDRDEKPEVRKHALWALRNIEPFSKTFIPPIAQALNDEAFEVRYQAAAVVFMFARWWKYSRAKPFPAKDLVLAIIKALNDDRNPIEHYNMGIGLISSLEMFLRRGLMNSVRRVRFATKAYFLTLSDPTLVRIWNNHYRRTDLIDSLRMLHPASKVAVPTLIRIIKDENEDASVLKSAASALKRIVPDKAIIAVPALIKILEDEKKAGYTVIEAVRLLREIAPNKAAVAVPALIRVMKKRGNIYNRRDALRLLGAEAKDATPTLLELIENNDEEPDIRKKAVQALKRIEHKEKAVAHYLKVLFNTNIDGFVREEILATLESILGTEVAILGLVRLLNDEKHNMKEEVAQALERIVIHSITQELENTKRRARYMTRLAKTGRTALADGLTNENPEVRKYAAQALGEFGPAAKSAIEVLENTAKNDPDEEVRNAANETLKKIGGK